MRVLPVIATLSLAALALAAVGALGGCGSGSTGGTLPSNGDDGGNPGQLPGGNDNFPPTGNSYVDARRCPACHQTQNPQTDGFMSGTVDPIAGSFGQGVKLYGPNLTPDPTTGIGNWDDQQITNAIMNGIDAQGERLCPQMQHFPDMQPDELSSILGYLHSLTPVVHQSATSSCPPLKP
ncbi:MAG TPA: hypothetical protein VIF15_16825 [Polyangiaceae bacterium]|jgi:hypothetical protein